MSAAALVAQGYGGYAGWNDAEADADFASTGGSGKYTGGDQGVTAESFANDLLKSQEEQIKRETGFLEQYTKDNPFVFDEELARQSATEEYSPYYSELLSDYVSDLNKQRETTRDEATLLTTLKKLDLGARTRDYQLAVEKAGEGFAGQGLFFSGMRQRAQGLEQIQGKEGIAGAEAKYGTQEAGIQRTLEGYDTLEQRKQRDIGREQKTAIEGGILQRQKEAITQYQVPLEQAYYRQFPSASGGALKGYTVPEYYRY